MSYIAASSVSTPSFGVQEEKRSSGLYNKKRNENNNNNNVKKQNIVHGIERFH